MKINVEVSELSPYENKNTLGIISKGDSEQGMRLDEQEFQEIQNQIADDAMTEDIRRNGD